MEAQWKENLDNYQTKINLTDPDYQLDIPGYTHIRTTVDEASKQQNIISLEKSSKRGSGDTKYYIKYRTETDYQFVDWLSTATYGKKTGTIYFVYQKDSSSENPGASGVGDLAHRKYIKANGDGTYDLTLDVTGAVGTKNNPMKVDIVLVLDLSGSMKEYNNSTYQSNIEDAKEAITTLADSLVEKEETDLVDPRWKLVTFSNSAKIATNSWKNTAAIKEDVSWYGKDNCSGGTNYEAGLTKAGSALGNARSDAQKVVVFLTDGQPTYYGTSSQGGGSYTTWDDYNGAKQGAAEITCNQFYAIGMNLPKNVGEEHWDGVPYSGLRVLQDVAGEVKGNPSTQVLNVANADLNTVFSGIAGSILRYYASDVTIVDQLTDEVDQVSGTSLTVKITDEEGRDVTDPENGEARLTASYEGKTLRLDFDDEYQLRDNYTYSVTIRIQPNEIAKQNYIKNGYSYPDTGEEDTDAVGNNTSEGKPGFFSNVENLAKVTWTTTGGAEKEGTYNRPVVQLPKEDVPVQPPTTEKELSKEKYIKDNKDGTYDLTLNVSGKVGSLEQKEKVDIVFVLDLSGSMAEDDGNYWNPKTNLKKAQDAITALTENLEGDETVDSRWKLVTFSNRLRPEDSLSENWVDASAIRNKVNAFRSDYKRKFDNWTVDTGDCAGGTNYEAALKEAGEQINTAREDAEKIVIFLTDGQPTYHGENQQGGYTYTVQADYDGALNGAKAISCNQFYSIGMNLPADIGWDEDRGYQAGLNMSGTELLRNVTDQVSAGKKQTMNVDKDADLSEVFKDIAGSITSFLCSDVTITDTLSQWAEVADENAELKIVVKNKGETVAESENGNVHEGAEVTLPKTQTNKEEAQLKARYVEEGRKIILDFPDDYQLESGFTYYVTVKIAPTIEAYEKYQTNHTYPDLGDPGTDAKDNDPITSSDKQGFYSNTEASVTYTYNGEEQTEQYPKPVIQVDEMSTEDTPFLTVSKTFIGLSFEDVKALKEKTGDEAFKITVTKQGDPECSAELTLNDPSDKMTVSSDGMTYTWKLSGWTEGSYVVQESGAALEGYTLDTTGTTEQGNTITISDGDWKFEPDVAEMTGDTKDFQIQDDSLIIVALRQPGRYLVWTKEGLSLTQQKAIQEFINNCEDSDKTPWKDFYTDAVSKIYFYSGKETLESGIKYGGSELQLEEKTFGGTQLTLGPDRQWNKVLTGTYQMCGSVLADLPVTNTYTETAISLDFQKFGTAYTTGQLEAKFKLEKMETETKGGQEITKLTGESKEIAEKLVTENDKNDFGDLKPGVYRLTETEAPNGYSLLKEPIYFKIQDRKVTLVTVDEDNVITEIEHADMYRVIPPTSQDGNYTIQILNETLYDLPSAGSSGIFGYTMGGTLLLMAGTLILYKMKRKEVQES